MSVSSAGVVVLFGGDKYLLETELYFAGQTVDKKYKKAFDAYVRGLMTAGIWTLIDARFIFAGPNTTLALRNIKSPGTLDLTASPTPPTFTINEGYTGNGVSALLSLTAPGNLPIYAQDSAHLLIGIRTAGTDAAIIGAIGTTVTTFFPTSAGNATGRINGTATDIYGANADRVGLYHQIRDASTTHRALKNGILLGAAGETSVAETGQADPIRVFRNGGNYATDQVSIFGVGGALSNDQAVVDNTLWSNYLAAIA